MDLEQLIKLLITEKGGTKEQYHLLLNTIANHESKGDPSVHQKGGGPGRGLYQFEVGKNRGGKTATNRLIRYLKTKNKQIPQWLKNVSKNNSIDASTLTPEQQSMLFLGNMREHPKADFSKLWKGDEKIVDFWAKYHWAGDSKDEFKRRKSFEESSKYMDSFTIKKVNDLPNKEHVKPGFFKKNSNAVIEEEFKKTIKPLDNIHQPNMDYRLNLDKLNLNKVKPLPALKEKHESTVNNNYAFLNGLNNKNIAALGGNLNSQEYVGEFNEFNEGGLHSENPHGGIPQGVGENGKLNTVEQGESSYEFKEGKYIFSNRLKLDGSGYKEHAQFANGGNINDCNCGCPGKPPCPDTNIKKYNISYINPKK
jgi:hypothetical protein